jgi:GAG-pre-integrase domain
MTSKFFKIQHRLTRHNEAFIRDSDQLDDHNIDTPTFDLQDVPTAYEETKAQMLEWHCRLGHLPFNKIQELAKRGDLPSKFAKCPPPMCGACLYAKKTHKPLRGRHSGNRPNGVANTRVSGTNEWIPHEATLHHCHGCSSTILATCHLPTSKRAHHRQDTRGQGSIRVACRHVRHHDQALPNRQRNF